MVGSRSAPQPVLLRTGGDASAGLVVPPGQPDRMAALLRFTAAGGQEYQVELSRGDVGRLAADLVGLLSASADQTCRWWYRLSRRDVAAGLPPPIAAERST
jgi:hypothetical protein